MLRVEREKFRRIKENWIRTKTTGLPKKNEEGERTQGKGIRENEIK